MYLIGITGPSGSGKSTLAAKLADRLSCRTLCLTQDMYYKDTPQLSDRQRRQLNYDAPQRFDFELLQGDLSRLAQEQPIERREYDYVRYRRNDTGEMIGPAPVVILEGIHIFYREEIAALCNLKIFVQLDADLCFCAVCAATSPSGDARWTVWRSSMRAASSPCMKNMCETMRRLPIW